MILFRSAAKQIAHRHGYHATFMCRPKLPNVFASGWHLHQSIVSRGSGENVFTTKDGGEVLSAFGRHYLAGLLKHARASAVFTTPTINGYKRYRSYSLAPDRAIWGRDNRGVMVRVLGGPGDPATRLENRIGEPAANPYLYMASQILSGLDGVDRALDPGPSADTPYETKADLLPKTLREAVTALERRSVLPRRARRGLCRLLRPHQERRDRTLSGRGIGLGAARIFRDVLRAGDQNRVCWRHYVTISPAGRKRGRSFPMKKLSRIAIAASLLMCAPAGALLAQNAPSNETPAASTPAQTARARRATGRHAARARTPPPRTPAGATYASPPRIRPRPRPRRTPERRKRSRRRR